MMAGRSDKCDGVRRTFHNSLGRRFVHISLLTLILLGVCGLVRDAMAQKKAAQPQKEVYTRPKPTVPAKPAIPAANRYQQDKVFLEKADSLFTRASFDEEHQIVTGNVVFRQANMWMYCDSAYYYPQRNSMDAFGHVKMTQGDTLFIYSDKLYYDGIARHARLINGPSQPKVTMKNRTVTLVTDSLDYDLLLEQGWYDCGGELSDDINTLTSRTGKYSPSTKDAEFYFDVVLVNRKDGYTLYSDTLLYNTDSHLARIVTPTRILGESDTIITSSGTYNTTSGVADLTSRSTIIHTDTAGNVTTLVGDSIIYDKPTHISRAYAFRAPGKVSRPMVLTDTARHSMLIGGFGLYNDLTREAVAADYPLLKEFSRPDTIFLRADTIRTRVLSARVPDPNFQQSIPALSPDEAAPDSLQMAIPEIDKEYYEARAYPRARFFKQDIQGIADSIRFVELDSMVYLYRKPIIWSDERQVNGNLIELHLNDSTADWARLPDYGLMMEHVEEDFYNQLTGKKMFATFEGQTLKRLEAEGTVMTIFLPQENDSSYNRLVYAESSNLSIDMDGNDLQKLKMWPEVTGDVTPIFLVKKSQKLLPKAVWHADLRPVRQWLDYRWTWDDSLGELSPQLEEYFRKVREEMPIVTDPDEEKENKEDKEEKQ